MSRHLRARNVDSQKRLKVVIVPGNGNDEDELDELSRQQFYADAAQETSQTSRPEVEIPTPEVKTFHPIDPNAKRTNFKRPHHYIHFSQSIGPHFVTSSVHYDLRYEDMMWCDANGLVQDLVESLLDLFERTAGAKTSQYDCEGVFGFAEAERLARIELPESESIVQTVYSYWIEKRRRLKRSLLRIFEEPPRYDDPSPHVAFRARENMRRISTRNPRKNDGDSYFKMRALRRDIQHVIHILEFLTKREVFKRTGLCLAAEDFDCRLSQTSSVSDILSKLAEDQSVRDREILHELTSSLPRSAYERDILNRSRVKKRRPPTAKRPVASSNGPRAGSKPSLTANVNSTISPFAQPHKTLFDFKFANLPVSSDSESSEGELESDVAFYTQIEKYLASADVSARKKSRRLVDTHPNHIGQIVGRYGRCNQLWLDPIIFDKFNMREAKVASTVAPLGVASPAQTASKAPHLAPVPQTS